jgi:hypothetical protein
MLKTLKRVLPAPVVALAYRMRNAARSRLAQRQGLLGSDPRRTRAMIGQVDSGWRYRIDLAVACPDNAFIPRVAGAGELRDGLMTMHNGITLGGLSYYGPGMLNLLIENRGVHEPQEERAFAEVLKHVSPGGTMLELGAYWGFYSLWFCKAVPGARCFLVEPDAYHLKSGENNFRINACPAVFHHAYAGEREGIAEDQVPIISVDGFCRSHGIDHLSILHSDIQGAEAAMLRGASAMLDERMIDFLFISTHTNDLHAECIALLQASKYVVLASVDMDQSFSIDGLIVARRAEIAAPAAVDVALKGVERKERGA